MFRPSLELWRWEHDAYPSAGDDAQDVINRQIPHDYDIFVGLMWSRFGTPTKRAGSGTSEEFERALTRFSTNPDDLSILFYFKDTPIPPSKLDPNQLQLLNEFKSSLKSSGVLFWEFSDPEQFEKLVSMHITKHVQNWRSRHQAATDTPSSSTETPSIQSEITVYPITQIEDDDDGYLDLLEAFEEGSAEVVRIANRLTEAQLELTAHTTQNTNDLQTLAASSSRNDPSHARRLISKAADEMLKFTDRVNAEVPLLRNAMNTSMNALTKAATLSAEFDIEQTHAAKNAAASLLTALTNARLSMVGFKDSTLALPRITKELNSAKRKQAAALDSLIVEFENGEQLLVEALAVIETLLQPRQ